MASSINASTSGGGGVIVTSDATGNLDIQSGGSTVVAVTSTGASVTGTLAVSGGVTLTTTLPVLQGGTGVTTSTGTGAGVHSVGPSISSAVMSTMASSVITSGTAVASTSGTSIDFTGIPSWVKRITVCFSGTSVNSSSIPMVQIGSGSPTTSGYSASAGGGNSTSGNSVANFTTGFGTLDVGGSSIVLQGAMTIRLMNSSTNLWCASGTFGSPTTTSAYWMGGTVALSGVLDRVRLTTVNGTDTFDAGSVNILYE